LSINDISEDLHSKFASGKGFKVFGDFLGSKTNFDFCCASAYWYSGRDASENICFAKWSI